jgi:hypothetical protein
MKTCNGCKFAKWQTTEAGRLHPSGDGRCMYEYKVPPLPACMYWIGKASETPCGGHINRRKELRDHCPYWSER